jgi:hypothetical protein
MASQQKLYIIAISFPPFCSQITLLYISVGGALFHCKHIKGFNMTMMMIELEVFFVVFNLISIAEEKYFPAKQFNQN